MAILYHTRVLYIIPLCGIPSSIGLDRQPFFLSKNASGRQVVGTPPPRRRLRPGCRTGLVINGEGLGDSARACGEEWNAVRSGFRGGARHAPPLF